MTLRWNSLYLLQNRYYVIQFWKPSDFRRIRRWVGNIFSNRYKSKYVSGTCTRSPERCLYYSYRRKSNKGNTLALLKQSVTEQTGGSWHTCRYVSFIYSCNSQDPSPPLCYWFLYYFFDRYRQLMILCHCMFITLSFQHGRELYSRWGWIER